MKNLSEAPITKIGKVSSQSVLKCTGKNWTQWVKILNDQGANAWTHKDIVKFLKTKYKLGPWWQQGVTSGYEIHIGRRIPGQNQKGDYSTVATKNLSSSPKKVWTFLLSAKGIKIWLDPLSILKIKPSAEFEVYGGIYGEVRTMKVLRRIRLSWQEVEWAKPSIVQVTLVARPEKKCILVFQHDSLKDEALKSKMLKHWKDVLAKIEKILEK